MLALVGVPGHSNSLPGLRMTDTISNFVSIVLGPGLTFYEKMKSKCNMINKSLYKPSI